MHDIVLLFVGFLVGSVLTYMFSVLAAAADCRACQRRLTATHVPCECDIARRDELNTLDWWYGDAVTWRDLQAEMQRHLPKP